MQFIPTKCNLVRQTDIFSPKNTILVRQNQIYSDKMQFFNKSFQTIQNF
jgi:hypothetical protein